MQKFFHILFFVFLLLLSNILFAQQYVTVAYDNSGADYPNPERGLYPYREAPLTLSYVQGLRAQNITTIWRLYNIGAYRNGPLSATFLQQVENDLNVAREGGVKLILRYRYTVSQTGEDAPLDTILMHIDQLAPVWQANYDVIDYIEAGFIGAWGEWYYSSNGLNNTNDRRTVLYAILDALPTERSVVIRTPGYKKRIYQTTVPLSPDDAFDGSNRARTGAHNDCFLASEDDYGTYEDIEADKTYLNLDNRYVPQGGETCNPGTFAHCTNALADLARMRWSGLNKDYHTAVLQRFIAEGCMGEIKRRLGYRFRLLDATLPDSLLPGSEFRLNFSLVNDGWASPFNPRLVEVMLRNVQDSTTYFLETGEDPRFWLGGDTVATEIIGGIPANLPAGRYEIMLNLPDPMPQLKRRNVFAIRLANLNTWDEATGYNSLLHDLVVDPAAGGTPYTGSAFFNILDTSTDIEPLERNVPDTHILEGNYPNPFNPSTIVRLNVLPAYSIDPVELTIFDITGKRVKTLLDRALAQGVHEIEWDGSNHNGSPVNSGVYILRLKSSSHFETLKIQLVR